MRQYLEKGMYVEQEVAICAFDCDASS